MRRGGCSIVQQQSLTVEAASMVKQAVSLARKRGHTQVTPLHVAAVMLASSSSAGGLQLLLRKACLQSHPLQYCRALDLCFNVALNRLPTTTTTTAATISSSSHLFPSLSNSLVAAFKRAHAHQRRRGSTDHNQQAEPVLSVKVEVEQLVISILDDPSVSRVMREAGFSSTHIKNNFENAVSLSLSDNSQITATPITSKKPAHQAGGGNDPSLKRLWHPLTVPVGSLSLTLNLESDSQDLFRGNKVKGVEGSFCLDKFGTETKHLTCCAFCLANFKRESQQSLTNSTSHNNEHSTTGSILPSWLQQYKEEGENLIQTTTNNNQEIEKIRDLSKKWNSICNSIHKKPHFLEKGINASSSSPSSSTSVSSFEIRSPKLQETIQNWPVIVELDHCSHKEYQFLLSKNEAAANSEPNLGTNYAPISRPDLSSPNSASSSEVISEDMECKERFKKLNNSENYLKSICDVLERKAPRHGDIIPEIVRTILQCRLGMLKRPRNRLKQRQERKQETWLFFLGVDKDSKEKIAREVAKVFFGSQTRFMSMEAELSSSFFSMEETSSRKRAREEHGRIRRRRRSYLERFAEAIQEDPSRVFFMEGAEQLDYSSQMGIKKAIESGRITLPVGDSVPLKDAIVIFSSETFISVSRACWSGIRHKESDSNLEDSKPSTSVLDLNLIITDEDYNNCDYECSVSDVGILESVDSQVVFKINVL